MYICECGCVFQEPEEVYYDHGFVGGVYEYHKVCPHCGLENYDEAVRCIRCHQWMPALSVRGSCFCRDCQGKINERFHRSLEDYKKDEREYLEDRVIENGIEWFMEGENRNG